MRYAAKLKDVLKEYNKTFSYIDPGDIDLSREQAEYLQGKSLVTVRRYTDVGFSVIPTGLGITYFDDHRDKMMRFWIPTTISIVSLIKSFMPEIISLMRLLVQISQ